MSYYEDIYFKRLNRYGFNYQSRIQTKREKVFEGKLLKSVYRVDFEYNDELHPATLERYKQDETETLGYLLTRVNLNIPSGTILEIPDKDDVKQKWMVYWLENMEASGYNRYIVLRMTHQISWIDRSGILRTSDAYMYGQENNMLKDEIKSRSRSDALYTENLKMSFLVMPLNENLQKDDYIEIGEGLLKEAYRVTGYDRQSTKGVEFVTVDPVYIRDNTPPPSDDDDNPDKNFWLNGGFNERS